MNKGSSGFTLIELLIVIFVIAIVAAAALYALNPARRIGESNDARRKSELESVAKAVEFYTADNGSAPTDIAHSGIEVGSKYVLCSSAGSLTCGNQTLPCRVVDDTEFLGEYLPSLPIDPTKTSTADTGYYVTRSNNNSLILGACATYSGSPVEVAVRVNLPTYAAVCADGIVGGAEVCDYSGTVCPNNASYYYDDYVYDGSTCTGNKYACSSACDACINQASCLGTCDEGGVYSGGYCYYMATSDIQSCVDVCAEHDANVQPGGVCTNTAWNDDASCTIMTALVGCGSCESSALASAPQKNTTDNICQYHSTATGICTGIPGIEGFLRLCACSK